MNFGIISERMTRLDMNIQEILLLLIINFFHLFLGYGYSSLLLPHQIKKRPLFLTAWAALWIALNTLFYYVLTGALALRILSATIIGLVLLCSAIVFNIFDKMQEKTDAAIKEALYNHQLEYYAKQYQEISRGQQEFRRMRHELKNNYILLETLARKGDLNGILHCLPQMYQTAPARLQAHTGNMVVDSVINHRISSTEDAHIQYQLNLNIPTQLDASDIRLCGLLGNALDNAVEATMHVSEEKRCISISMQIEKKNLFIEISNPYDGTILSDEKGNLLTRKANTSRHGYGLSVMKELLGNNLGNMETTWDKNTFYLRIILYSVI